MNYLTWLTIGLHIIYFAIQIIFYTPVCYTHCYCYRARYSTLVK